MRNLVLLLIVLCIFGLFLNVCMDSYGIKKLESKMQAAESRISRLEQLELIHHGSP